MPDARRKRSRQAAGLGETPRRRWRNATPGGKAGVPGTAFGARETQARGSRTAHQVRNGGGSASGLAIPYPYRVSENAPGGWSDSLHPGGSDWSDSLQSAHPSPASYRPATAQNLRFQGVFLKGNILESGQSFWHEVCMSEKRAGVWRSAGQPTLGSPRTAVPRRSNGTQSQRATDLSQH